jgi:regulator of telomere elongation helicase 1
MDFQMTPMSQDSSIKALSSILDIKRGNASGQVGEVLPANRSSLTPFKNQSLVLKHLSDPIGNVKKLLMPGRKNLQYQDPEIIDLTGYSVLDEQLSKEELMAPCSARKRKLLSAENVAMQKIEVSHERSSDGKKFEINGTSFSINPVKLESSQISDTISAQNAQVSSALLHKDDGTSQKREVDFLRQKNKGSDSIPVLSGNEETRGSNFLIQVKCSQCKLFSCTNVCFNYI